MAQTEAYDGNTNVELFLSWRPGVQLVSVQIRILKIPDSVTSELKTFESDQVDLECVAEAGYLNTTTYTFTVPENDNDEPTHIETYQYELSCRAHDIVVNIEDVGGGTTSTAKATAILN